MIMRRTQDRVQDPRKVVHYCHLEGTHDRWGCMCPCEICETERNRVSAVTESGGRGIVDQATEIRLTNQ